jgi:GMP synthase (glutamine-hydrolysing)
MGAQSTEQETEDHRGESGDVEVAHYLEESLAQVASAGAALPTGSAQAAPQPIQQELIIVLDFGSQYSRLIARRVREARVYCELLPAGTPWETIAARNPRGVILSGGPNSVYDGDAPLAPPELLTGQVPVLGICYGMHAIAHQLGGTVAHVGQREYGPATLHAVGVEDAPTGSASETDNPLFAGLPSPMPVWMSHGDTVTTLPHGFKTLAFTETTPVAALGNGRLSGLQFHPEVVHTPYGKGIIENFVRRVCGCHGTWTPGNIVEESVARIRAQVGVEGRVICALSGGVDSAVAATLLARAIGDRLVCVFVDNGFLRKDEGKQLVEVFGRDLAVNFVHVDASERFLPAVQGVVDPEQKRTIIGHEFIRVFEEQARAIRATFGQVDYLAMGTLYPDVIESTSHDTSHAVRIKTHHNVGGLPPDMAFRTVEPLRYLFKDEVREVGLALGLPEAMVYRQPFPGPGLAIRIIGEVDRARLDVLREADHIVVTEIKAAGLYRQLWQSFAILTPIKSVGVMGDFRTYANVVAVRAVVSDDAMTADWARLPYDLLARISNRIVNEIPQVNRVVYDISSKPPSTIEWE